MKNRQVIQSIRTQADSLKQVSDERLRELSLELKYQAMTGANIRDLIPRGFALVVEASIANSAKSITMCNFFAGCSWPLVASPK